MLVKLCGPRGRRLMRASRLLMAAAPAHGRRLSAGERTATGYSRRQIRQATRLTNKSTMISSAFAPRKTGVISRCISPQGPS